MKTKTTKSFDAVKMMREIRDKIDKDLTGKTSEEILAYYEQRKKKMEKRKVLKKKILSSST